MTDTLNIYSSDEYLGKVLVNKGVITPEQLDVTLRAQDESRKSGSQSVPGLGQLLVEKGILAKDDVLKTIILDVSKSESTGVPNTLAVPSSSGIMNTPVPVEVTDAAADPKKVFGKYVLLKELGRGGFAVVYKAWDTLLRQFVALKLILTQHNADQGDSTTQQDIDDFVREARTCASLRHPNFIHVYEVNKVGNRFYISMELVDGPTFSEMIHGPDRHSTRTHFPSDPERFIKVLRDVSLAVDYAHHRNPPLVHRDLKPQNILISPDGAPYVADLGLAKEVKVGHSDTMTGVVKGTPWYMAPEQAEGKSKEVDARTDVYALGGILYEMLTGRTPFHAARSENLNALLRKIVMTEPERPNKVIETLLKENTDASHPPKYVSKQLETIALKALEKHKIHRYQTAKEFSDDLERYLKSETIIAREKSFGRRFVDRLKARPVVTACIVGLLLAAGAAGAILSAAPPGKADPAEAILRRAKEAQAAPDWPKLRTAVDDLKREAPQHPGTARYRTAVEEHDRDDQKRRDDWKAGLERLRGDLSEIDRLEKAFPGCPELAPDLRRAYEKAADEIESGARGRAREIAALPRAEWVKSAVKEEAKRLDAGLGALDGLKGRGPLAWAAKPGLEADRKALGGVVAYLGTFTLRANVLPFADFSVFAGDREVAKEQTPAELRNLEIPAGPCRVEFYWPSREKPEKRLKQDLAGLRHQETILIGGDLRKDALEVRR